MALPTVLLKAKNAISKGKQALNMAKEKSAGEEATGALTGMIKGVALGILSTLALPILIIAGVIIFIVVVFSLITAIPFLVFGVDLGGGSSSGSSVTGIDYLQWAIDIANDDSHGYSQCNRTGPDYDCSSLVYYSLLNNGYTEEQLGGSWPFTTFTMTSILPNIGFDRHDYNESELQPGDILWRNTHTGIYVGDGQVVQASSSREGNGLCGRTGDQDGTEIWVSQNTGNWTAFYRKSS